MINKRGSTLLWILIILFVISAGIFVYFLLSGDGVTPAVNTGGSIPQPPALPSGYNTFLFHETQAKNLKTNVS